ncbi:MAG: DUF3105 domain-containing protein [Blastococcus sp.]
MAKDRTPAAGKGRPSGGRTRPTTQVVAQQRPWGLIAAALVVVVFAVAVIWYAVGQVNKANADKITSADQITGLKTFAYAAGQNHVTTPVSYKESPPVGGPHDPNWADCTGTVYTVDIRHENAVHSLEHGAVWITYNPDKLSKADVATLAKLVDGVTHRLMSPYKGLDAPISLQSWNHQLKVSSVGDKRIKQFADFFTQNTDFFPEVGASCENPDFAAHPLVVGSSSTPVGPTDMPTSPSPAAPSSAAGTTGG